MKESRIFCGIFETESGQQLLLQATCALKIILKDVWITLERQIDDTSARLARYQKILDAICRWPENVQEQEAARVTSQYPSFAVTMRYNMKQWALALHHDTSTFVSERIIAPHVLVHRLMMCAARQDAIRNGDYYRFNSILQKDLVMDVIRQSFADLALDFYTVVELGSQDENARGGSSVSRRMRQGQDGTDKHSHAQTKTSGPPHLTLAHATQTQDSHDAVDVAPSDSISNVTLKSGSEARRPSEIIERVRLKGTGMGGTISTKLSEIREGEEG